MICRDCCLGGELIAAKRRLNDKDFPDLAKAEFEALADIVGLAMFFHSLCENKCDCQHKIDLEGNTIDWSRVNNGQETTESI